MKKTLFVISFLILAMLIFPLVSADLITPGFKYVQIENKITNIGDFQDYNLISYCENIGMSPIQIVQSDGIIPGGYKLCQFSVYAIKKDKVDLSIIDLDINNKTKFNEFINSVNAVKLVENIVSFTQIPVSSSVEKITKEYTLDLNKVKNAQDKTKIISSNYIYFYLIISLVALIVIIIIILRRENNG